MSEHKWSGWPGAFCLNCGAEDPLEIALADGRLDDDGLVTLTPEEIASLECSAASADPVRQASGQVIAAWDDLDQAFPNRDLSSAIDKLRNALEAKR